MNITGGCYGNTLQLASYDGHCANVRLLLEHEANMDVQGSEYGAVLQPGCLEGNEAIVWSVQEHGGRGCTGRALWGCTGGSVETRPCVIVGCCLSRERE